LVGNTSTGLTSDGINLHGNGTLEVRRNLSTAHSSTVAYMSRGSTDGNVIQLYKDTTHAGSIGAKDGDMYLGTGDTGLRFHDGNNQVYPTSTTTGTSLDATVDLGHSGGRFKDLYLSGGVYLGGTGAANKLDDYEEGTWTPTITNSGFTNSASSLTATYTKVGNTVHFELNIVFANATTVSSHVYISGFPFVSAGSGDSFARQACGIYNCDDPATGAGYDVGFIRAGQVSGQITLYKGINPASDTKWLARGSVRVT
jgi:hypothetical protein